MDEIEKLRYLIKAVDREGNLQFLELLKPLKITPSQSEILVILEKEAGISLADLGELLICGSDNPSRLVKRLADKKLIYLKNDPKDTRKKQLYLSEEGSKLIPMINKIEEEFNQLISQRLPISMSVADLNDLLEQQIQGSQTLRKIEKRATL